MTDVFNAIKTNTAEIGVAKEKINSINDAVSSELNVLSDSVVKGTITGMRGQPTTVDAQKQELSAQLAEQTANQQRASTVDFEQYSNDLLATIKQQGQIKTDKLQEIQNINTSSNPIDHIVGLVTIPFKAQQAVDAENIATAKTQELAAVNQLMQSSAKTTAEIQTRVTESTNASVAEALAHDQMIQATKARIMALQTNAHGIKDILGLSEQQLRNKVKEFEIGEAMDMRALRKEQIKQMMALREQVNKEQNARELSVDFINQALMANGKEPVPADKVPLIADQLNKPGPFGDMMRELFDQGAKGVLAGGEFVQGSTPVEAAEFRNKIGYTPQTETERDTLATVDGLMTRSKPVLEAKSVAEKVNAANSVVKAKLEADQENISTDRNSLAKPISWATMAASDAFRNNRLFKEVIAPQITDNISTDAVEPTELFKRLSTAVKNKQAKIDEAVALYNNYANLSMHMNNNITGLTKFTGLKQTKFTVRLPQPRAKTQLFKFGGMESPGSILVDSASKFMPYENVPVDATNQPKLYNAFATFLSGELREPQTAAK